MGVGPAPDSEIRTAAGHRRASRRRRTRWPATAWSTRRPRRPQPHAEVHLRSPRALVLERRPEGGRGGRTGAAPVPKVQDHRTTAANAFNGHGSCIVKVGWSKDSGSTFADAPAQRPGDPAADRAVRGDQLVNETPVARMRGRRDVGDDPAAQHRQLGHDPVAVARRLPDAGGENENHHTPKGTRSDRN